MVTRDNELTSQEDFFLVALEARPGHRRDPERAANTIFAIEARELTALCRQGTSHSPGAKQARALGTSPQLAWKSVQQVVRVSRDVCLLFLSSFS